MGADDSMDMSADTPAPVPAGDNDVAKYSADVSALRELVLVAYATAEDVELQRRAESATMQARNAALSTSAAAFAARADMLAAASGSSAALVEELAAVRAVLAKRAEAAETDRDDLAARLAASEAERTFASEALARAAAAAVDDANALAEAQARVADLTAFRRGAEARLASSSAENAALVREGRDIAETAEANAARLEFLEKDRVRMAGDLAEIRSQHDMATVAHEREVDRLSTHITSLTEGLDHMRRTAQVAEERVHMLERQTADLQVDRERARADGQREIDNLNGQLEIHRESLRDAESRIAELKEVVESMSVTVEAAEARAISAATAGGGGLGAHADALLKHVQTQLDARMDELEEQRVEFEQARYNERQMAITSEALRRERDTAIAAVEDTETRARTSEAEVEELQRRNEMLERRIKAAGDEELMQNTGVRPQLQQVQYVMSGDSGTGGVLIDAPGGANNSFMPVTPAKATLDSSLQEVMMLRQRHDDLIANMAAQRDRYRDMLNSS
jgi:hypothetical protein